MGLKCSLLGHSFEPADFEREREKQGSEVVTVVREIERCVRCGEERVVSESTEVTAVVDEEEVSLDDGADPGGAGGGVADHGAAGAGLGSPASDEFEARDPAEEDTEILTDEEPERDPGAWPEDPDGEWDPDETGADPDDDGDETGTDPDDGPVAPDEEILSGITVPEGKIVCTECDFGVDAESSYRDGDPCPDCGAWLTSERNR